MGCFLACFGGDKEDPAFLRRRRKKRRATRIHGPCVADVLGKRIPPQLLVDAGDASKTLGSLISSSWEWSSDRKDGGDGASGECRKKKVTFDLNVKIYEAVAADNDEDDISADGETPECELPLPKTEAFPLNHRYGDCADGECEDDYEDYYDDGDLEDDEGVDEIDEPGEEFDPLGVVVEEDEDSYESFFSLPPEIEQEAAGQEANSPAPAKTDPAARDRSQFVHAVLNPVENVSQWKEAKVRAATAVPKILDKENFSVALPQPTTCGTRKKEVSVDASLSTWLVSSDNSVGQQESPESRPVRSFSSVSREDRPILGALTLEDIKSSSVTSSPRRSPCRNPDEIPIIGTVGSHWHCSSKISKSRYC